MYVRTGVRQSVGWILGLGGRAGGGGAADNFFHRLLDIRTYVRYNGSMSEGRTGVGLAEVVTALREMVSGFDPSVLDGAAAVLALEQFGEVERLAAAGLALASARVEATRAWQGSGTRSAAHFVAARSGSTVRSAVVALETAKRLESLPATD